MTLLFVATLFAALCVLCFVRPSAVVGLALVIYPFEQWAFSVSGYFRAHPTMVNFGFGILVLIAVAAVICRGHNPLTPLTSSLVFWAILLVYAATSFAWSINPDTTIHMIRFHLPYVLTFVLLVPLTVRSSDDLATGLKIGMIVGALVTILLLTGTRVHDWGRTIAISGSIAVRSGERTSRLSPLTIADMSGAMIVLASLINFRRQGQVLTAFRWGLITLSMILLIRSGSRGQVIASLLVVIMLVGLSRGYTRHLQLAGGGLIAILLLALAAWAFEQFNTTGTARWTWEGMQRDFAGTRLDMCLTMLSRWARSLPLVWIIGLGSSAAYDSTLVGIYPHVVVIEVLTELGLLGLSLYAAFLVATARAFQQAWGLVREDRYQRGLLCASGGLFLYHFILTFKQGSMLTHTALFLFALLGSRLHLFLLEDYYARQHKRMRAGLALASWLQRRRSMLQTS